MHLKTDLLTDNYTPLLAVMVYDNGNSKYYLESHSVSEKGQILEGKPLKQETLDGIVDVFFDERKSRQQIEGIVPDNLLFFKTVNGGGYKMVWYRPAEVRLLHFKESLHIKSGTAWVPSVLYIAERKNLSVYALISDSRPKEAAKLYKAPFHNVYEDGLVCLGNASVKSPSEKTFATEMKYWEDLFWLSEFSHLNNGGQNPTVTNVNTLWKRLIASKETIKWSKLNELMLMKNLTLKSLLK